MHIQYARPTKRTRRVYLRGLQARAWVRATEDLVTVLLHLLRWPSLDLVARAFTFFRLFIIQRLLSKTMSGYSTRAKYAGNEHTSHTTFSIL